MQKVLLFLFMMPAIVFAQLNKDHFYKAMQAESVTTVTQQKKNLESLAGGSEKNAFFGAILMKESQFLSTPKARLDQFKQGRALLESEIRAHSSNAEFRLLRLMIQENCPKILGYNKEIRSDAEFISKQYLALSAQIQGVVKGYSSHSPALKSQGTIQ